MKTEMNAEQRAQAQVNGRKGGARLKETRGPDYFREIGARGGAKTKKLYGSAHYKAMGKKGGDAVLAKHGSESFVEKGRKGGRKMAERGPEFYRDIGSRGAARLKALVAAGKKAEEDGKS